MNRFSWLTYLIVLTLVAGCGPDSATTDSSQSPAGTSDAANTSAAAPRKITDQIVEASCGQCQFGMPGSGCDLAIRIDGESWYVDGSSIDDHGDAHGDDGLCNCIRQAKVTGEIREGRFVATQFVVLPRDEKTAD